MNTRNNKFMGEQSRFYQYNLTRAQSQSREFGIDPRHWMSARNIIAKTVASVFVWTLGKGEYVRQRILVDSDSYWFPERGIARGAKDRSTRGWRNVPPTGCSQAWVTCWMFADRMTMKWEMFGCTPGHAWMICTNTTINQICTKQSQTRKITKRPQQTHA